MAAPSAEGLAGYADGRNRGSSAAVEIAGPQPSLGGSGDSVLEQAIASSRAGCFSDAERLFKQFLLRQPNHVRALNQLGILLVQIGRYEEAERHIRQAISLGLRSGATFYNHGTILKVLQRPLEALDAFNKALAISPADPETWNNRGAVFNDLARYGEAIDDFDKAIALRHDFAGAFSNKAKSLLLSGRHDEAFATYDKALAIRPELLEVWLGRANACYQLKRYDEALAAYDKCLALEPNLAQAWLGRGSCFGHLKRYDEAVAAFDKALTIKPDLAEAWLGRADSCFQLERYGDALAASERALALKPDFAQAWLGRGALFAHIKRHEDAIAAFDKALTIRPDLAEAWLGRGDALQALNRPEEAVVAYRQALATGGDSEIIQYILASLSAEAAPVTAPRHLITGLFDQYADIFDAHLVGKLKYRAPDLLFDAMTRFAQSGKLDILDLGCGTGLVGARFRPLARTLTGLDFSSNMLRVAKQRQIYDNLIRSELTEFLQTQTKSFDLALAADVFLYIGDLSAVFQGIRGALRDGGLFGFSVEISAEQDFVLRPNRHYAHSGAYLRRLSERHGFVVETIESGVIRQDNGIDVVGYLAVLRCR
jgi:predicted TPR repeat methyltransferase